MSSSCSSGTDSPAGGTAASPPPEPTASDTTTPDTTGPDTTTPDTTAPAPPPPPSPSTTASASTTCLEEMPLRRLIALLVWPSVYANDWDTARRVVGDLGVGGVLLMRPRSGEDELRRRIAQLDASSALGVVVATDEEGGDVQRLVDIEPFPSQREVSSVASPEQARQLVADHAAMVDRVGVDVVLGPVVDVAPDDGRPPLQRSRFFVGGPDAVAAYGRAYAEGWMSAGLTPVLKHFPGHGAASGDTHLGAGTTPELSVLESRDLLPFRDLADTGAAVMVGHLTVPGLTGGLPATFSAEAISTLRETLGYSDAPVISDALDMAAAGTSVPDAAVASIAAGIDAVLFTSPGITGEVIDAIAGAVDEGRIARDRIDVAARRVLGLIEQHGGGCPN